MNFIYISIQIFSIFDKESKKRFHEFHSYYIQNRNFKDFIDFSHPSMLFIFKCIKFTRMPAVIRLVTWLRSLGAHVWFEAINTKIELSLKQMNIPLLMNAIHEHNYVERLTRDINFLLCKQIFILYYILALSSQLFFYISQKDDTLFSHRIFFRTFGIFYIILLLAMYISCNQICTRAHKSY